MGQANAQYAQTASLIQTIEGYFPGSVSYANNNPGNLKYVGQAGATGQDSRGFAIFPTYDAGFAALENQVAYDANHGLTIAQFTAKYAPASDGNNPTSYANTIANTFGLSPSDPLTATASDAVLMPGTTDAPGTTDPFTQLLPDLGSSLGDLTGGLDPTTLLILGVSALVAIALLKGR